MAADIDDFIRQQKLKMQFERQQLGPGQVGNVNGGRPAPITHPDRVGDILKEDVPHPEDRSRGVGMSVESKKALIDGRDGGAALPGIGERPTVPRRLGAQRNQDYNAFKEAEEAKFRDRFADRKPRRQQPPPPGPQQPQAPQLPLQPAHAATIAPQYSMALVQPDAQLPPQAFNGARQPNDFVAPPGEHPGGPRNNPPPYDQKLQELERTVAELRDQMSRRGPRPVAPPVPGPPRQGWATPDYGDMVALKRREEAMRHRLEDPELFGALMSEQDRRFEDLDAELNSQKVQLMSRRDGRAGRRPPPNFMDDGDAWLRVGAVPDVDKSLNNLEARLQGRRAPGRQPGTERRRGPGQSGARGDNNAALGSLPVGHEERVSAKHRRQETYRSELQRQMAEQQAAKARERQERLAPPSQAVPTTSRQQPTQRNRDPGPGGELSQLPAMPLQPGLDNLPSLSAYNTPADDAYFYYGSKNPLEDTLDESQIQQPAMNSGNFPRPTGRGQPALEGQATSRVANRFRMQGASSDNPLAEGGVDPRDAERRRKAEYAQELQRQMQEASEAKARRKREQEEYDRKKDAEIAVYYPFESKTGGGGEPIKRNGEVVADLRRQGRSEDAAPGTARTARTARTAGPVEGLKLQLSGSFGDGLLGSSRGFGETASGAGTQRTQHQVNAHGEATHARGGHGVFGQPKSEEEKAKTDSYKEQLRLQIEERKRQKEEEAKRLKLEEEKEQKRFEEHRKKIQMELEEEQRRQKEKIDEVNRRNEEIWQQAEAKKRQEAERKRRRSGGQADAVGAPLPSQTRPESPPIPAVRRQPGSEPRSLRSPPIPSIQRQQRIVQSPAGGRPPRPDSSRREIHERPDVLRQLERMKKELQSERVKVEDALKGSPPPNRTQPDSSRYEVVPMSARGRRSRAEDLDIFELARQGRSGPVVVRSQRPRGDLANADVLKEFRNLKLRDSEVGRNVRQEHPGTPLTSDLLEVQQNTYLRQQDEFIQNLNGRPVVMERYQTPAERDVIPIKRDPTPRQPLFDDQEVASQYSFDVENLNQRTEERMRRLSRLNVDGVSLQDQEEVLDRFMRQRTHTTNEAERAPSVRNRETSYDMPTHGVKQTSFGGLQQDDRTTSYHNPAPAEAVRPPTAVSAASDVAGPGGPTPVDDTWLNPTRRRLP